MAKGATFIVARDRVKNNILTHHTYQGVVTFPANFSFAGTKKGYVEGRGHYLKTNLPLFAVVARGHPRERPPPLPPCSFVTLSGFFQ